MTTQLTIQIASPSSCQFSAQTGVKKLICRWQASTRPAKTACKWLSDILQADSALNTPPSWLPKAQPAMPALEQGPQDTWAAIEDIWLRLTAHCAVKQRCQCGTHELIFVGLKTAALNGHVSQLRSLVSDVATYSWQTDEHRGQFVQFIEYQGVDLMLQVKPMAHIERWPDGEDMASQVKSLLLRLPRIGHPS